VADLHRATEGWVGLPHSETGYIPHEEAIEVRDYILKNLDRLRRIYGLGK